MLTALGWVCTSFADYNSLTLVSPSSVRLVNEFSNMPVPSKAKQQGKLCQHLLKELQFLLFPVDVNLMCSLLLFP